MILLRLGSLCARKSNLSQRFLSRTGVLNFSSKNNQDQKPIKLVEEDVDHPVTYSKTKAYTYLARNSRYIEHNWPDCQPYVIVFSLTIFMIYFCILREENDLDEMIYMPLETRLQEIEKATGRRT